MCSTKTLITAKGGRAFVYFERLSLGTRTSIVRFFAMLLFALALNCVYDVLCYAQSGPPVPSMNRGFSGGSSRGSGSRGGRAGSMGFRFGPSYLSLAHKQSNASAVTYSALAPELNIILPLSRSTFLEGGGYYSALEIGNSTSADITYWSGFGRLIFPFISGRKNNWYLGPGVFYRTMTVSTNNFGYQDISGPDISTYLEFNLKRKQRIQIGGRYGLVYTGEIAVGASRELNGFLKIALPVKKNFFTFQFDYTKTTAELTTTTRTTVTVNSTVMRFSILFGK
ncbi:MAG TPA: hypothetical protein PLH57_11230 [Oligoflexia bacterium]|nr:hypothetical protein [Oligoflexia bacterium]